MTHAEIVSQTVADICAANPVAQEHMPLPLDESLLELGILDSFGVVEMVSHLEKKWSIRIFDNELTKEKFGSINKMARLISEKLAEKSTGGPCAQKPA